MSDSIDAPIATIRHVIFAAVVALTTLAAAGGARAQATSPSPPQKSLIIQVTPAQTPVVPPTPAVPQDQTSPPVAPPPADVVAPRENPGLINELGKLFKAPPWTLPSLPALPALRNPTDSGDALPRLTLVVKGRMACPLSANGAPDCKAGADRLCRSKGFKDGKSLDTDAAQTCSAKALLSGRKAEEGECKTENFVTQALCQ